MATRDLMNDINPLVAVAPQVVADGSSLVSVAIDTKGYESVTFIVLLGTLADADATWTVTVKDGDDGTQGNHAAVADTFLVGTEALAGIAAADDDSLCKKIGYTGGKRYVSIEIDNAVANTGNAPIAVLALLGHPHSRPTANPPV